VSNSNQDKYMFMFALLFNHRMPSPVSFVDSISQVLSKSFKRWE